MDQHQIDRLRWQSATPGVTGFLERAVDRMVEVLVAVCGTRTWGS